MIGVDMLSTQNEALLLKQIAIQDQLVAWYIDWRQPSHEQVNRFADRLTLNEVKTFLNNNRMVGFIALMPTSSDKASRVMYGIAPKYQKRGYATAALEAVVNYSTERLGMETVIAEVDSTNTVSQRVVSRVGFVPSGMRGRDIIYMFDLANRARCR